MDKENNYGPKKMQNIVVLMEPSDELYYIGYKGGNMCLNRFCIDEDAAFELSGVNEFASFDVFRGTRNMEKSEYRHKIKGKGVFSTSRLYFTGFIPVLYAGSAQYHQV